MRRAICTLLLLLFAAALKAAPDRLAAIRSDLQNLALDPGQTYRVRELEFASSGAKIYFTEGVLSFATPVDGHRIAAVFTTSMVDAGDAEVIAFPPLAAERASLAHFTQSPNLDQHFTSALLYFADDIGQDLLKQIHQRPVHPAPDLAAKLATYMGEPLRKGAGEIDVRIARSILDRHSPSNSFLYGMMAAPALGPFDVIIQPDQSDALVIGRLAENPDKRLFFQVWASFDSIKGSANNTGVKPPPVYQISGYRIDTVVKPDLSMTLTADFDYQADSDDGAVISLLLTPRLRVTTATIDGSPAAVLFHDSPRTADVSGTSSFLLVSPTELAPGTRHQVHVAYQGSVINRLPDGSYFVDDRNSWYPFVEPVLTSFDLTFHGPENLRLMCTGEPVSDEVVNGQRTVHCVTAAPQSLAGFNLGEYTVAASESPPYRIQICSNPATVPAPDLAEQTARILAYFTSRWSPLPGRNLAVTPITGYFGQGFPGLIYLSSISYLRERDRPLGLRSPGFDFFFSQLLLPHELAHQWWGNIVTPVDYHSEWIVEAMANYAALQYLEQTQGRAALETVLAGYRADLTRPRADGNLVDANGPLTFGQRLLSNYGLPIWHDVLYEKGTWVFHMLRTRMGDTAFHTFQLRLLKDFARRPISNDDLRQEAARFVPPNEPDRQLTSFFDTWVYDTGIPMLALKSGNLMMSGVPDGFLLEVPLSCPSNAPAPAWLRAIEGKTPLPAKNCSLPSPKLFLYRELEKIP